MLFEVTTILYLFSLKLQLQHGYRDKFSDGRNTNAAQWTVMESYKNINHVKMELFPTQEVITRSVGKIFSI